MEAINTVAPVVSKAKSGCNDCCAPRKTHTPLSITNAVKVTTTEMHTGGEPLRIVEGGFPELDGATILHKMRQLKEKQDLWRKFVMWEPRGHHDMYGAVIVKPDLPEADLAVIFIHNEGFGTMCGHAVISLSRYAIDCGYIKSPPTEPETAVKIQCPCGLVRAFVEYKNGITGRTRFLSVPSFAFVIDFEIEIAPFGKIKVDIGYGGAFYAHVVDKYLNLDLNKSKMRDVKEAAAAVSDALRKVLKLTHPASNDLAFLSGTIVTDGLDAFSETPSKNVCVFANKQIDRCPCGSGVTSRIAVHHAKRLIKQGQRRLFESAASGSLFTGMVVEETTCGSLPAVVVEIAGNGYYLGQNTYIMEEDDPLTFGFMVD